MNMTKMNRIALMLCLVGSLGACALMASNEAPLMPISPPPKPLDIDKVDAAVRKASSETAGTTIYSNVFNLSGGSCVDASKTRGQAIATSLQDMKDKGDIPSDHTVKVYTYSGYRVPGIEYGSLHTYTVTQLSDGTGKPVATWTSDNYLGPSSVTKLPGDGGYGNWNDPLTEEVKPPKPTSDGGPGERKGGGGGH